MDKYVNIHLVRGHVRIYEKRMIFLKTKLLSIGIIGFLALIMAIPALAASNSYSFTMNYRVVDGSANGQFHTLKSGTASIRGSHYQYSAEPNSVGPNPVNYQLYNKTSGNSFGIVKSTPTTDGSSKSFSGSYSGLGGGTSYYLFIWRTDDGRNIKGSGLIFN
jgi:hypothetical protein